MGGYGDVQLLKEDGTRLDGRTVDEMRAVEVVAGVLPAADGSAMVRHGKNVAVCAVYGPMEAHPRKIQRQDRAVIDVRYNMAPFSTTDRIRPGFNRRSREISKVTPKRSRALCSSSATLGPRSGSRSRSSVLKRGPVALASLPHPLPWLTQASR